MADGMDAYISSLKLAQPIASYQAGAEIAAKYKQIALQTEAQNFDKAMKVLEVGTRARQVASQEELARARLAESSRQNDVRNDLASRRLQVQQDHWANPRSGSSSTWAQPPPMDSQTSSPDSATDGELEWLRANNANPAPAGTQTDDLSSFAPGSAPNPGYSDGPIVPGGQSAPADDPVELARAQRDPSAMPARPTAQESQGMGSLLPPVQAQPKANIVRETDTLRRVESILPNGDTQIIGEKWDGKNGGRWTTFGQPRIIKAAKSEQAAQVPWTEDDEGRKWKDGVQVEPIKGKTTVSGKTVYDFNVVGDHPFEVDPEDPTKGILKGAAGIKTPVTIEGMQVDKNGKVSYRLKTDKSDETLETAAPAEQAKRIKTLADSYRDIGMEASSFRFDKQGNAIANSVKPVAGPKTDKVNNSIGALRHDFSPEAQAQIDTLLSKIKGADYDAAEKAPFVPKDADRNDPKVWENAWKETQRSYAIKLSNMLNERHNGKPGFKPVSVDELVKWGGRAPAGASDIPPPDAAHAPPAGDSPTPPGLPPGGFSDDDLQGMGLNPPAAKPAPSSWMKKLGIGG